MRAPLIVSGRLMPGKAVKAAAVVNILVLDAGTKRASGLMLIIVRPASSVMTSPYRDPLGISDKIARTRLSRLVLASDDDALGWLAWL